ncbi:hypothetical protein ACVNPZ_13040 [Staphylococcus aureus]
MEGVNYLTKRKEVSEAPVNFGANLGLMLDLYDDFLQDPSSVPEDLQVLFIQLIIMTQLYQL